MFRNVASQVVAAQLVSKTDGSAVTSGTTTVNYLKDGGTQGSGAGTVTHEGNGCWSYVPVQAETDGDHLAFTFVNSSAISVTVQIYTVDKVVADALSAGAKTILIGTVGAGSDATHVVASAVALAGNASVGTNAQAGKRIYFLGNTTTSSLRDCAARIISNTSGATPTFTLDSNDTLPASPAAGDSFIIS